jgi:Saccharopine dehydrogenase NADP binding domain
MEKGCAPGFAMISNRAVAVFGAYGHTGRFVVAELSRRGWRLTLVGRDAAKLEVLASSYPGSETRVASVEDRESLDHAISGASVVINCAGPFLDSAAPVLSAALRARVHYLDVAAEQAAVLATFKEFADAARQAGVAAVPAMAFYGGLGDLLATAAMGDWAEADEILILAALDSWKPTRGTRLTGQRNPGQRFIFSNHRFDRGDPAPPCTWNFPPPFGEQMMQGLTLSETIIIPQHLKTREVRAYLNQTAIRDVRDPATPAPTAADESGRSSQIFVLEAAVRKGGAERRAMARGRDIYAVAAPIVAEAAERLVNGGAKKTGVLAAGEAFEARDFLTSLGPEHLSSRFSKGLGIASDGVIPLIDGLRRK